MELQRRLRRRRRRLPYSKLGDPFIKNLHQHSTHQDISITPDKMLRYCSDYSEACGEVINSYPTVLTGIMSRVTINSLSPTGLSRPYVNRSNFLQFTGNKKSNSSSSIVKPGPVISKSSARPSTQPARVRNNPGTPQRPIARKHSRKPIKNLQTTKKYHHSP